MSEIDMEYKTLLAMADKKVAAKDPAILVRMAEALMAEFPDEDGFQTVLGQLSHFYLEMLLSAYHDEVDAEEDAE